MKTRCIVLIAALALLAFINCSGGGSSEAKEYTHNTAGFKITAPANWEMIEQTSEAFEFRRGNFMLIEVAGSIFEEEVDYIMHNPDFEPSLLLEDAALLFLKEYCKEAGMTGYKFYELKFTIFLILEVCNG